MLYRWYQILKGIITPVSLLACLFLRGSWSSGRRTALGRASKAKHDAVQVEGGAKEEVMKVAKRENMTKGLRIMCMQSDKPTDRSVHSSIASAPEVRPKEHSRPASEPVKAGQAGFAHKINELRDQARPAHTGCQRFARLSNIIVYSPQPPKRRRECVKRASRIITLRHAPPHPNLPRNSNPLKLNS